MSSSPAPTRWFLDSRRNLRFRYDARSDTMVYEDGSSCPRPSTMPRSTFMQEGRSAIMSRSSETSPREPQGAYSTARPMAQIVTTPRSSVPQAPDSRAQQTPRVYPEYYTTNPAKSRSNTPSPEPSSQAARETSRSTIHSLSSPLQSLNLGLPAGRSREQYRSQYPAFPPQQPPGVHPGQVQPTYYQRGGMRVVETRDPRSGVNTSIATAPASKITDPTLYEASGGKSAKALLLGDGTEGDQERLYSTFRVRSHNFFCLGRVFLVLWVEPAGATVVTSVERSDGILPGRYQGELIYSKVRRFVVIREGSQYCSVLPIMSYGHRGVGRQGVVKSEHAIIYTGSTPPAELPSEKPVRGEAGMRQNPIRVVPDDPTDKLDPVSRIDFVQVHTVQHNVKVRPFGMVHQNSLSALYTQFSNAWRGPSPSESRRPDITVPPSMIGSGTAPVKLRAEPSVVPFDAADRSDEDDGDDSDDGDDAIGNEENPPLPDSAQSRQAFRSQATTPPFVVTAQVRSAYHQLRTDGITHQQSIYQLAVSSVRSQPSLSFRDVLDILRRGIDPLVPPKPCSQTSNNSEKEL